jgi:hypothetical protein
MPTIADTNQTREANLVTKKEVSDKMSENTTIEKLKEKKST